MSKTDSETNPESLSETLFLRSAEEAGEAASWWSNYVGQLSAISPTAQNVLEADCRYILEKGIRGEGGHRASVRRGLVMGSVQSGKTASMFGVAALALDDQMDVVVVLAGTRLSLWRQTFSRLRIQLDTGPEGALRERRRLLVPRPGEVAGPDGRLPLSMLYRLEPAQVRRAIRDRRPIIIVAMKHADHLRALGKSLRETVFPAAAIAGRPFRMIVLDDEADDGSILDAAIEQGEDPIYGSLKQIPRAIAELWNPHAGGIGPDNLESTYVAYTATPQANFLQQDHNPLAPTDFVVALRTAYDVGAIAPRESTYFEPNGFYSYYTGGETFYKRGATAHLCVAAGEDPVLDRADAVRAYLVASAIQHLRSDKLGPRSAQDRVFSSKDEALELGPAPRSMLIHPSALVSDHFEVALDLLEWAGAARLDAEQRLSASIAYLPDALILTLTSNEAAWRKWLTAYIESAAQIRAAFDLPEAKAFPLWSEIADVLRTEIIPGTRLSVVNSDPTADDRPEYEPWEDAEGWHPPRDLSTIFISGNVMSRGLTLEGLTTTLFLRHSNQPFADTQMQMQRWFGYRNRYVELCRLIAPQQQLDMFASFHDGDEALRQVVLHAMNDENTLVPTPIVLQGQGFLATGKIANLRNYPLCPGPKPFIGLVNNGEQEDPNMRVLLDLFESNQSADVSAGGRVRGRMLTNPLALDEAADVLDRLRFAGYAPGSDSWQGQLWAEVQARVESQGGLPATYSLYRPAIPEGSARASKVRRDCPYSISAYMRLWAAALSRRIRGLFPTESALVRWSGLDLEARSRQQPRFWVGIRYGGGPVVDSGSLATLPFSLRVMERTVQDGKFAATWGSRDPSAGPNGYRGDEFLDYYFRGEPPPRPLPDESSWRPVGSDGLILFHVNMLEGQAFPTVTVGVCIPLGGPDQFSATAPAPTPGGSPAE